MLGEITPSGDYSIFNYLTYIKFAITNSYTELYEVISIYLFNIFMLDSAYVPLLLLVHFKIIVSDLEMVIFRPISWKVYPNILIFALDNSYPIYERL